jgi:hypothetical protein
MTKERILSLENLSFEWVRREPNTTHTGGVPLKLTFSERVAEVHVSPKFFEILRIVLKYIHIIMTMGMY